MTAEAAAWYRLQGKTLLDVLDDLYARFGYYEEKVKTFTFAGREGMEKIAGIMDDLRRQPPEQLSDMKVRALRDYETGIRLAADGQETSLGLPPSNVLYFELEGGSRFVIRPSGTEPKIKLYFGTVDIDQRTATARLEALMDDVLHRYFQ